MYNDFLGFGYEVLVDDHESGVRKTHITPVVDAPAMLVKVIGDSVSFEEHGQLHRGDATHYAFTVIPGVFPKRIKISGEMSIEPNGNERCWRIVAFKVECKILGIGKLFERFVSKEIERNYQESAGFTNKYLNNDLPPKPAHATA